MEICVITYTVYSQTSQFFILQINFGVFLAKGSTLLSILDIFANFIFEALCDNYVQFL